MRKSLALACAAVLVLFLRSVKRMKHTARPLPRAKSLLLIAHPDDESMFFAPTLLHLRGHVIILCLSNGGYYGKGTTRISEMKSLCAYLNVKTAILEFRDNGNWSPEIISVILEVFQRMYRFRYIYTFDDKGVSGHKNHIACHMGAKIFSKKTNTPAFYLRSKNLVSKYCFDLCVSKTAAYINLAEILLPLRMMLFHRSQLTWYRFIYIFASSYMQYNDYL